MIDKTRNPNTISMLVSSKRYTKSICYFVQKKGEKNEALMPLFPNKMSKQDNRVLIHPVVSHISLGGMWVICRKKLLVRKLQQKKLGYHMARIRYDQPLTIHSLTIQQACTVKKLQICTSLHFLKFLILIILLKLYTKLYTLKN